MQETSKIVVVVFDGLRPDMVTPILMPNLHAYSVANSWFREARSVFPSMTRVATSSMATGAMPVIHGIVGNAFYYPEVSRDFVLDVSLASDIALAEATLNGRFITATTFGDVLAAHGRNLAVVHSGSPGSTYAINPGAAINNHWTFSVLGEAHTKTPHAVREMVARFGPLPPRNLPRFEEIDYATRVLTEHVLPDINPDVALIWFNEPDTSFHYKFLGSEETLAVLAHVDAAFQRILDTIAARSDAQDIALIIASDHGQISSSGQVDITELLTGAGHPAAKASARALDGAALAVTGGNMGEIRVLDGDLDRRDAVARWLMAQEFTGMVFTPSDDPILGSVPGTFSTRLVELHHPRSPELVYVLRSDTSRDAHGLPGLGLITGSVPVGGGMHGGLNRHELNTLLVLGGSAANGSAITDVPAGIIDIGPTILDLLGLPQPVSMQGHTLRSAADHAVERHAFTASTGGFVQSLAIASRGGATFLVHGERQG
ncbi:alkaline phosphatase family protein [Rhabdaerophilum sp. SD176]|uniref:alkaline phosphatase family protein n=1 Tax=Rhabdaerophilum sp. SD176 TaxID=2983548 RepID=UPI0024DF8AE6|nr:alkaline phosphatase family protein [Rhabdaerophilum sp. SD176]